jgi:hypothetical protein
MKVIIDEVTLVGNEIVVNFSTGFGSGGSIWNGGAPKVREFHDVELEGMLRFL